jgi:GT2 family glycosyltransferase
MIFMNLLLNATTESFIHQLELTYTQTAARVLSQFVFREIIERPSIALNEFGLMPVCTSTDGIRFAIPALRNKVFSWRLQRPLGSEPLTEIALLLGTGNRVNHCCLVLEISIAEQLIASATLAGEHCIDNAWGIFHLSQALPAGEYQCRLFSPDSDNAHHALFLWLTPHSVSLAHSLSHYRYVVSTPDVLNTRLQALSHRPTFSFLLVATAIHTTAQLQACLSCIAQQVYPHWALVLVHDVCHAETVNAFQARAKINIVSQRQSLAERYQIGLQKITTPYLILLDIASDRITPDALLSFAENFSDADMLYGDDDVLSPTGNYIEPAFKPDWSPEWCKSMPYVGNFVAYRTNVVKAKGGFTAFTTIHDIQNLFWGVMLFVTTAARVTHIPQILNHRILHSPTAPNLSVLEQFLQKEAYGGKASLVGQHVRIHYPVIGQPQVSIIIPTRDLASLLLRCLNSVQPDYPHWEVIVVDNGSVEDATHMVLSFYQKLWGTRFKVIQDAAAFNFSRLVNRGVHAAQGEFILLLNNDTEILSPKSWLSDMIGYAQLPHIGCVGAKLLYPDRSIQHAGVICGIGGIANHGHRYFGEQAEGYLQRLSVVSEYSAITGACLLVKRTLWVQVGGFDEKLAIAYNDVDFCLKLQKLGYQHVVLPDVCLIHDESKTRGLELSPEKKQRLATEQAYMQQRWGKRVVEDPFYNPHLTRASENFSLSSDSVYYVA